MSKSASPRVRRIKPKTGSLGKTRGLPDLGKMKRRRIKPFHDAIRYGFAVGRIRVFEMQMLNSPRVERMMETDFNGALYILDEIPIGGYLQDAKSVTEIDADLMAFLKNTYSLIAESLPRDSSLIDFFVCRYDFHNLKALLKARMEEKEPEGLMEGMGTLSIGALRKGITDVGLLASPYRETVEELAVRKANSQELDSVVDRHYFTYRLSLARREKSAFMIDFARTSIDLANLKQFLRARLLSKERELLEKSLIEGGFVTVAGLLEIYKEPAEAIAKKLESNHYFSKLLQQLGTEQEAVKLTDFDRLSDDQLMDLVRGTKRISVGVEPIFAYLRARENEVLMVRMILLAKLQNIPTASIEKTLRKLYIE